jgi:hypothetical protein
LNNNVQLIKHLKLTAARYLVKVICFQFTISFTRLSLKIKIFVTIIKEVYK